MAKSVQVKMEQTKVCKSCVRFDAVDDEQGEDTVGNVYLGLDSFTKLGNPKEITVTVSA